MPETNLNPQIVLTGVGMSATCGVAGYGGIAIQIQGSYTGTLTFEASVHGSEYEPMRVTKSDNSTPVTTTTTTGLYSASVSGYKAVRVRMSAHSLGSASVIMMAAPASTGGAGGGGGSGTDVNLIEVGGAAIALGETTMSASLPVVIASDQDPIPVTGSISATNPSVDATGDPVPADATYIGVSNASGDLTGLASVAVDLNSTTPPVVPVHGFYQALPGAGGPVVGGTATNPIRVLGTVLPTPAILGAPYTRKYYTNAGAVTDGIVWSPAGGTRWHMTSILINVSAACTVTLEDDLSGGDAPFAKMELAANSGWSSTFPVPLSSAEDAADLIITTSAGNVYVTAVGYEI